MQVRAHAGDHSAAGWHGRQPCGGHRLPGPLLQAVEPRPGCALCSLKLPADACCRAMRLQQAQDDALQDLKRVLKPYAGTLLRSVSFPVSLHSLLLGPGEHAIYAGGADGRIFEVPLAGQPVATLGAPPDLAHDVAPPHQRWAVLEGHSRTVTCLEATTDGGYMLSGA